MRKGLGGAFLVAVIAITGCTRDAQENLRRGEELLSKQAFAEAVIEYRKAIQRQPKSGPAYFGLARAQLGTRDGSAAYDAVRQARLLEPGNEEIASLYADVAMVAYLRGPGSQAIYNELGTAATELASKSAASFTALRIRGFLATMDRNTKAAVGFYSTAHQQKPADRDVTLALVQALFLDGQGAEGERVAAGFLEKEPTFEPLATVLYRYFIREKRVDEAESLLTRRVAALPESPLPRLALARHYHRLGRAAAVDEALRPLVAGAKPFQRGPILAAGLLSEIGRTEEAITLLRQGASSDTPDRPEYRRELLAQLTRIGRFQDALQVMEDVLRQEPANREARIARASLRGELGKPSEIADATEEFRKILLEAPPTADLHHRYGRVLFRGGDTAAARTEFRNAVRLQPTLVPAWLSLAALELGASNAEQALRHAEYALSLDPESSEASFLRVSSLIGLNRLNEARPVLYQLVKQFPQNKDVQLQVGLLALREKKYEEATAIFLRLRESGLTDSRAVIGLAQSLGERNQVEALVRLLADEAQRTAEPRMIRSLLADAALRAGKMNVALEQLSFLAETAGNSIQDIVRLAEFHQQQGDSAKALALLAKARETAPKSAIPLTYIAAIHERAGQTAQAQDVYRQALILEPNNPFVLNNLAYSLAENGGDLAEAMALAQRGLRAAPNEPGLLDTQAWIYLKKNDPANAIQILNTLVRRQPGVATLHYHLGAALLAKGERAKAKAALTAALQNNPSPDEAAKVKQILSSSGL